MRMPLNRQGRRVRAPLGGGRAKIENSSRRHPRKFGQKRFLAVRRSWRGNGVACFWATSLEKNFRRRNRDHLIPPRRMDAAVCRAEVCYPFGREHGRHRAVRRREFITLLGGVAAWPVAARAQQAGNVWRMGFIAHGHESFYDALFEGLREYGYEEGRNLIVERRYARGQAERFKEFAAEMVRLNVDIIIVVTTPAALAVMNATKTIPIVHPNAIDPLNTGLIASLAHTSAIERRNQRKTPLNSKASGAGAI